MQRVITFPVLLFLVGFSVSATKVDYSNHKVIRAIAQTDAEIDLLKKLGDEKPYLNFWTYPARPGTNVDIMLPTKYQDELCLFFEKHGIKWKVFIEDVQELINNEMVDSKDDSGFGWTSYHTLEEIEAWLRDLAEQYPQVKLINVGSTYEGRNLTGVHISYSPENANKGVFVESNIHAEEWITSATSTYILNEILTSSDPDVREMAESHDWYFVPVVNVDGFEYSHNVDRMWRKTRIPYGRCVGADPNRNWDNHWGEMGSSTNPCSSNYAGPHAFSENCTKSLSDYLKSIGNKLVAYFDFHSYSQLLMIPFGYSPLPLDNYNVTYPIGLDAAKTLAKRYGTQYTVGIIYTTIYPASGSSLDWVKASFKTPLAYVYELRDTGRYGFLLPPDQIIPTGQETLDSIVTIFKDYEKAMKNGSIN